MKIKWFICSILFVLSACHSEHQEQNDKDTQSQLNSAESTAVSEKIAPHGADALQAANAINKTDLANHIKVLSSDKFGGRAPATEGETLSINYMRDNFKKLNLKPANGDSYFQKVPLISVEAINHPHLEVKDKNNNTTNLSYLKDEMVWTRKQIDEASIKDSPMVFVGYGINAPELGWNDYKGLNVKGKTVLMLVNDPGYATQNPDLFNGNAMTYYGRWDYKYDEAAKQGASAAIIIHQTKPAAYPWSTVSSSWSGPQFDRVRQNKGADLVNIEGWITHDNAQKLMASVGLNLENLEKAAQQKDFKAVPLNLTASVHIENKLHQVDSHNVVAYLPGSTHPDEVFVYMAHWDHLGTDPTIEGDGIYNGALDNASGSAGLLELAKAFSSLKTKPQRSILFLSLTAEEQGLLGSAYYAAHPLFPLNKTVGGINMDMLNNFGRTRDVTIVGLGMSELDSIIAKQAKLQHRVLKPDAEAEKGYFYRSDHFELSKKGVPMLYPNRGYDDLKRGVAYGMQQAKDYVAHHYHSPKDEFDPNWDLSGAVEDLQLYFYTGLSLANSQQWPNWNPGSEFKALRDKQMQEKK